MSTFLCLNVRGIRDAKKRLSFLQWLSHLSADFVCLQEVHGKSIEEANSWFSSFGFSLRHFFRFVFLLGYCFVISFSLRFKEFLE